MDGRRDADEPRSAHAALHEFQDPLYVFVNQKFHRSECPWLNIGCPFGLISRLIHVLHHFLFPVSAAMHF
jgi:hypothetical protein